jgi:hypothetical protein
MNAPKPKLDIDTTRERLAVLGCSHAAEHLDQVLSDAVRQEIAPHAFLDLLLETELSGREARRVKTSLKLSNLPTGQTLENFDFAFQPAIERSRIDTLATCAWVRTAETVLIQGPPGVGKTHLCVGLGIRAVEQGFSVQYFRFDELMTALKIDAGLPPARLKRRKYMSTALLQTQRLKSGIRSSVNGCRSRLAPRSRARGVARRISAGMGREEPATAGPGGLRRGPSLTGSSGAHRSFRTARIVAELERYQARRRAGRC